MSRFKLPVIAGFFLGAVLFSCTEELTTIGATVVGGEPFTTDKATYEVFAFNKKIQAVRTNKLPLYQLGTFDDPIYGKTEARVTTQLQLSSGGNPTFGVNSQSVEDNPDTNVSSQIPENETVDSVYLYIPYLTKDQFSRDTDGDGVDDIFEKTEEDITDPNSDWDGDGVTDNQERLSGTDPFDPLSNDPEAEGFIMDNFAKMVDVDSIYGTIGDLVDLRVERSTYFLRDLDPNTGFQEAQEYFSSQQFSPDFVSEVLFDGQFTISDKEILLRNTDDPDTSDIDESEQFLKQNPGIRVPLDVAFFQENLIDKEGSSELLAQANFADFIRGIHLSANGANTDVMFLLDLRLANITVYYHYDRHDSSSNETEVENSSYTVSLLSGAQNTVTAGNAVNTLNNDPYPPEIIAQIDDSLNAASRIYLKGGSGSYAEIQLFELGNGEDIVNQIKANNWIINEANLIFHVDRDALDMVGGTIEPPRVYLYNAETGRIIFDPLTDVSDSQTLLGRFLNFGGILEKETGTDRGIQYKMRITDHINNMVVRDSANATLGLVLIPDIEQVGVTNAMLENGFEEDVAIGNTMTPLGTVLFGGNVEQENIEKQLRLEIFYTETN